MHTIKLTKVNHRSIHTSKPQNKGVQCIYTICSKEKRSFDCVKDRSNYAFIKFIYRYFFKTPVKPRFLAFILHIRKFFRLVAIAEQIPLNTHAQYSYLLIAMRSEHMPHTNTARNNCLQKGYPLYFPDKPYPQNKLYSLSNDECL